MKGLKRNLKFQNQVKRGFRKTRLRGFRTISADGMNEPSADINGLDSPDVARRVRWRARSRTQSQRTPSA